MPSLLIFLLCLCSTVVVYGQQFSLAFPLDSLPKRWLKKQAPPEGLTAAALQQYWPKQLARLHQLGYLEAQLGMPRQLDSQAYVLPIILGPVYRLEALALDSISPYQLAALGPKYWDLEGRAFSMAQIDELELALLKYAERHGYPFAQTHWQLNKIAGQDISAQLLLDQGPLIRLDSLDIRRKGKKKGPPPIRKGFLSPYLGLKQGQLYDERKIQAIRKRIAELPFLALTADPYILFEGNLARPILFVQKKNASRFDVIFGLLPNDNAIPPAPKFKFTGQVDIELLNPFGRGQRISGKWQQFETGRSELNLAYSAPYIFRTPLGLAADFSIYRRDSTYIDIIGELGISYLFDGNQELTAFWKNSSTSVQQMDTLAVLQNRKLPNLVDSRQNMLGLAYQLRRVDYRWNPRRGFILGLEGSLGQKTVRPNSAILNLRDPADLDFDFGQLYDSLSAVAQYQLSTDLQYFLPLASRLTIMGRHRMGYLIGAAEKYDNELFRLGGQQLLRAFDEQSILSEYYHLVSLEVRYILGQNSYSYLFGELAQFEQSNNQRKTYAFGAGLALETPVGVFAISYALGNYWENAILFRNAKIHFGYLNRF